MKSRKLLFLLVAFVTATTLAACSNENDQTSPEEKSTNEEHSNGHAGMDHSGSSEVPTGLQVAENPTYTVGSKAIIEEGHMSGMKGAEATIVGAFDTVVYAISYDPTSGGERVENHKWVIHEEIVDAGEKPFEPGDEVKVEAAHMEGMENATAVIDSAEETTVYMIDFTPTDGGEKVTYHKWVTEDELSPVE